MSEPDASDASGNDGRSSGSFNADGVRTVLAWGTLGVLVLLAVVAAFNFYGSVSAAIGAWVAPRYRPLFRAGFNLVVLLVAGVGISALARHLDAIRE